MTSESMRWACAPMGATVLAAMLALSACGGGGSDSAVPPVAVVPVPPPASAASSPVGPGQTATVTISGPNGAAVAVPAGAASAPVTIVVAQAGAGAPALPASAAAASAIYEITPHGQAFDKAVDVAIPFDAASIAAGERPILLKAEPGGEWAAITDVRVDGGMLHALVADFSYFAVASCGSYAVTTCATTPALSLKVAAPSISSAASAVLASPPAGSASDLVAVVQRFAPVQIEVELTAPAVCLSSRSKLGVVLSNNIDQIGIFREPTAVKTLSPVMTLAYTGSDDDFVVRRTRAVGTTLVADLTAFYTYVPTGIDNVVFAAVATCRASLGFNLSSSPIRFTLDLPSLRAALGLPFAVVEAPSDQTVAVGQTAIFYVTAASDTNSSTNYQWERSDDAGATWVSIAGAQKPRYELVNARLDDNGARFRAVLLGYDSSHGSQLAVVSDAATLTVSSSLPAVDPVDPIASTAPWQADSVIGAGGSATFVVHYDRTLTSWGTNNGGVLGRASAADGSPQPVALADVRSVVSGAWYAAALVGNGDVYAWGWGGNVGTAIGSTSLDNALPQKVTGLANIRAIATRYQHTLALDVNGDVYGFGPEAPGGLGPMLGNDGVRKIAGIANVRQVAAGDTHSLALRSDGTVWAWGGNGSGQLGVSTAGAIQVAPVMVPGLSDVVGIAASSYASFALRSDGTVWSWGQAFMLGRTGDPGTPTQITSLSLVSAIAAGNYNAFAVKSTGQAYGWGDNTAGRVGVGSTAATVDVPAAFTTLGFTRQITGGEVTGLAVASTGAIFAWGSNAYGGLGGPVNGVPRADSDAPVDTDVER